MTKHEFELSQHDAHKSLRNTQTFQHCALKLFVLIISLYLQLAFRRNGAAVCEADDLLSHVEEF